MPSDRNTATGAMHRTARPLWRRRLFWDLLGLGAVILGALALACSLTQPLWIRGERTPSPPADPAALERHVRFLCGPCVPRDHGHPENLSRAADYIAASLAASGGRVSELDYAVARSPARVIRARFGPEGPVRLVVGAHYDAHGPHPAADDNASGTAGLLELGRLLGAHPPAACVELAAYPHEEMFGTPDMGSRHHAAALREAGEPVELMVSLEMIGYFSGAEGTQQYPLPILDLLYPSRGDFIAVVGRGEERRAIRAFKGAMVRGADVPVCSVCAPFPVPGLDLSDHSSFWRAGYRAVMVTDTAFLRNPNYHAAGDTPQSLDYRRMAEVVRGVCAAVLAATGTA